MNNYDDIINHERHISLKRKPMSMENRACQFAPFAALTGYDEQILETSRITDQKNELSIDQKISIDLKLQSINKRIKDKPLLEVTFFVNDLKKDGGYYKTIKKNIRIIDVINKYIEFTDKTIIDIDSIIDIK